MGDGSPRGTRNGLVLILPFVALAGLIWWLQLPMQPAPAPQSAAAVKPDAAEPEVAAAPKPEVAAEPEVAPEPQVAAAPKQQTAPEVTTAPEPQTEPQTAPEPEVATLPEPETAAEPKADLVAEPKAEEGAPAAAAAVVPGFDVVRVEPDGSAAVAGTAAPGAKVTVFADQTPLAEAEADARGNFVAVFKVEPSEAPRALTLGATPPEGGAATSSDDMVMLLPKAPLAVDEAEAEPKTAALAAETPAGTTARPARQLVGGPKARPAKAVEAGTQVAAVAPEASATAPEVAVTAIVRGDTVEVLPAAGTDVAGKDAALSLASISYTHAGQVTLAGVGKAGSVLRAYVDDSFAQEARVGADGHWAMDLGGVAEGLYKLRIDQLAADGKVARRVETPFQRDYPHAPPPRPGQPRPVEGAVAGTVAGTATGTMAGTVTVQPGNNLWTLARERYGSGVMYTQIFTANREQIRNPDLIYPGQIFSMPEATE